MTLYRKASVARTKPGIYQRILVTTDGSESSARGIEHGLALAQVLLANIIVLRVAEPVDREIAKEVVAGGIENFITRPDVQNEDTLKNQFAWIEQKAVEYGIYVELLREIEDIPAKAIIKAARLTGCDLIVMATRGWRGAQRLMLGSQIDAVLTHTDVPVLVVR